MSTIDLEPYVAGVRSGSRLWIGRAITLVESTRADHRDAAQELLVELLPDAGGARRIGISGVPGVGKSTFIGALGSQLTAAGSKVAVLAVDPSSTRSGGSILGDKTRMDALATDDDAFIRPSPTAGTLGGVAKATRETMVVMEAAGYDVVIVETVGVGQSETAVAEMVDSFLFLTLARTGDSLQGIKRGILEIADVIAVNKADGPHARDAQRAARELESALKMLRGERDPWQVPVLTCSAQERTGLDDVWSALVRHQEFLESREEFAAKRARQQVDWTWQMVRERLLGRLRDHPQVKEIRADTEREVLDGELTPALAADRILMRSAPERASGAPTRRQHLEHRRGRRRGLPRGECPDAPDDPRPQPAQHHAPAHLVHREVGDERHPHPGLDEPADHREVVGVEGDVRGEPGSRAHLHELLAADLPGVADPRRVAQRRDVDLVGRAHARVLEGGVARREGDVDDVVEQPGRRQALGCRAPPGSARSRSRHVAEGDGEVELALAHQIGAVLGLAQLEGEPYAGVAAAEHPDRSGQQPRPGAREGGQAQPARAQRGEVGHLLRGPGQASGHDVGVLDEQRPRLGGVHPAGVAHQQRRRDLAFQGADLLRHRGRGVAELHGRAAHRAGADDRAQHEEAPRIEHEAQLNAGSRDRRFSRGGNGRTMDA